MAICISHGKESSNHIKNLDQWARTNTICDGWTVPSKAKPGDILLVYILAPVSSLVASAEVLDVPVPGDEYGWPGKHMAPIGNIQMLDPYITREELLKNFKGWKWPNSPQSACIVPIEFEKELQKLTRGRLVSLAGSRKKKSGSKSSGNAKDEQPKAATDIEAALEGLKSEYVAYRSKRSKPLRDAKLAESDGVCECCKTNFKEFLDGKGARVLQVHHRKQLAFFETPKLTSKKDLAIVCANCHLMLHADPKKSLKVEKLAKMLAQSNP